LADTAELERLSEYVDQQRADFAATPEAAREFAGQSSVNPVQEAAAWAALARVLLNVDEFITRE
jgi:hypothetical protein